MATASTSQRASKASQNPAAFASPVPPTTTCTLSCRSTLLTSATTSSRTLSSRCVSTASAPRLYQPCPEMPALNLPDKPSIAVLPFTNLSGDPREDYFSDGITEDIITELCRFSELFVIARNSSFQYKGKSPDIRQVGRELGVRYVLEGSIRRAGERVRITGQLIDAATGAHRWAERYDRELKDVFAVQDEVARTIVAIIAAHVNKAEAERTLLSPPLFGRRTITTSRQRIASRPSL